MNVVQLPRRFTTSHWGGTETYVLEVSRRLRRGGHDAVVLCPNALASCDSEIVSDVPVRRVPYFYPYLGLDARARVQLDLCGGSLFSFQLLRALWDWPHLDLIHLHTGRRPGAIGRYVAMKRKIPYVVSVHGGVFDMPVAEQRARTAVTHGTLEWGRILGWWVGSRRVLDDAAAVICVGRREYEEISKRFPTKRVVYMPNGVDADRFRHGDGAGFRRRFGIPADAQVVISVGRLDPQKNQALLLRAWPRIKARNPRAHLLLVGHVTNEGYAAHLKELAGGLDGVTIVEGLPGHGTDIVDAYHAADCFVLPSVHEPFGIVILEAWAAGLPVVASRVGGIPGFVEDGVDALLCESGDDGAFSCAIDTVLKYDGISARLAEAGRHKACTEYGWDHLASRLISLYQEVVDANCVRK